MYLPNLDDLTLEELKRFNTNLEKNVLKIFNVKNSMNSKISYGGTAEKNIKKMIKTKKKEILWNLYTFFYYQYSCCCLVEKNQTQNLKEL